MPEPDVIRAMRVFRAAIAARDEAMLRKLVQRWAVLERQLEAAIQGLATETEKRVASGQSVSRYMVQQSARYERLISQTQAEMAQYADVAATVIGREQQAQMGLGIEHATETLGLLEPGIAGAFDVLPVAAFENMVGLVSDGSPLRTYLLRTYPQAAQAMTDALMQGVGLGWGAEKTAREMRRGAAVSLRSAMNTARTETTRAYRAATLGQYQESGVVMGYKRLAAKSTRTCAACLMMDGEWFPLTTPFEEHVCGRCTSVPAIEGGDAISWTTGREWFEGLNDGQQRQILGPGLFDAWRAGKIGLGDVPVLHEDPTWGNSWQVAKVPH
jgi:SPP1 gp7 family putative phage head morphogenesis protein